MDELGDDVALLKRLSTSETARRRPTVFGALRLRSVRGSTSCRCVLFSVYQEKEDSLASNETQYSTVFYVLVAAR